MNKFDYFMFDNYYGLKKNVNNTYLKNISNKITKMSAALTPDGIVTQQSPGESFGDLDDRLQTVHPVYRDDLKGKYQLGEHIDSIYQNFINSNEGQEFIKY